MSIKIYRVYSDDPNDEVESLADNNHFMSIVATEDEAKYAAPKQLEGTFNDERISMLLSQYKDWDDNTSKLDHPDTPLGWAEVLWQNIGFASVVPVPDDYVLDLQYTDDRFEDVVEDETARAQFYLDAKEEEINRRAAILEEYKNKKVIGEK